MEIFLWPSCVQATLSAAVPTPNNVCVSEIMRCVFVHEWYLTSPDPYRRQVFTQRCGRVWTLSVDLNHSQCIVFELWLPSYCMYSYCRWLSSQDIFHDLSCLWGCGWLRWRREGNAAFFRGAGPFGREQSQWKKNKAENSHRLLWHGGRLQFFHRRVFYAHIRTHKEDAESWKWRLPFTEKGWFHF